jgi:hypothetical protein
MDVKAIKQMEASLADARGKAKTELVAEIQTRITQLQDIGFGFELTETNGKPHIGRPKKERANGLPVS